MQDRLERRKRRGVIAWMAQNSVASNLLMLGLVVGGLVIGSTVKQEVFPEFDLDVISVGVPYPGASPAEVEQGIVLAIEEQVRALDGVKRVTASSAEGAAGVTIELELGTDPNKALADVKSAVDRITSFPEEAEEPTVSLVSNRKEVIAIAVYGDQSDEVLRQVAEDVKDDLLLSPDITYVELAGTRPREISIEVPQENLRRYGSSLPQIAAKVRQLAVELPGGGVKTAAGEVLVRTAERRDLAHEFETLPIITAEDGTEVTLGTIARVEDTFEDNDVSATFDGKPAVLVNVFRSGDETPVEVADVVHAYVKQTTEDGILPPGLELAALNDASQMFRERIDLLVRNAQLGLVLVLIVLGLFLNARLAFWVTMGIPISFLGSLLLMPLLDVSVNMISLFAFIITLGIVVDDAIVVGENIFEMRERGMGRMSAAITGARQIAVPVTFSVLTSIAAFSPLLFVPGPSGKFFRVIPSIVICVLTISLIESLLVLPAHLGHRSTLFTALQRFFLWPFRASVRKPLPRLGDDDPDPPKGRIVEALEAPQRRFSVWLQWVIDRAYDPTLKWVLEHRYAAVVIAASILIATFGFLASGRLPFTFLPKTDSDRITAQAVLQFGTPVAESEALRDRIEEAARKTLDEFGGPRYADGIFTLVGGRVRAGLGPSGPSGGSAGSHIAGVQVFLVPSDQRDFGASEFAEAWRQRVGEVIGLESLTFVYSTGPGAGSPIEVELAHDDIQVLEEAASEVAEALSSYAGVKDVDDGFARGKPQLDFELTPLGTSLGLTAEDVGRQVRGAFFGSEALRQQRGKDEVRVMVRLPEDERRSEYDIETLMLRTPDGGEVPLTMAAEVERGYAYTTIKRAEGRRVVPVTADVVPGKGNAGQVLASLRDEVLPGVVAKYAGLTYSFEGERKSQSESLGALAIGFPLALGAIFTLLAIPFGSYLQPLVVMSAIPFGLVGAVGGHLLMGYDLSLISIMGIVATSGIVVNDSLVLVHAANAFRADGHSSYESVRMAGTRRFRPILLTSLTTFFGLAPMIAETSVQARFLIPMAISLGFGILFATFVILLMVPALYLILEDVVRLFSGMPEDARDTHADDGQLGSPAEA